MQHNTAESMDPSTNFDRTGRFPQEAKLDKALFRFTIANDSGSAVAPMVTPFVFVVEPVYKSDLTPCHQIGKIDI